MSFTTNRSDAPVSPKPTPASTLIVFAFVVDDAKQLLRLLIRRRKMFDYAEVGVMFTATAQLFDMLYATRADGAKLT
jgi:hypothetical protein